MAKSRPDYILISLIAILLMTGLVILASASVAVSYRRFGTTSYYIVNQLLSGVLVGGLGFFAAQWIPYTFWKKMAIPMLLLAMSLLAVVVFTNFGFEALGARRWIRFKFIFFQPSEIAKLAIVVYLAGFFAKQKGQMLHFWQSTFPFILVLGIILGLIAKEPDAGTLGIIALTAGVMFFAAGGRWKYIGMGVAAGVALFFVLVKTAPYRFNRFLVYLHPETDPKGLGYQIQQALLAIGSGGVWGLGLGESRQKYNFLPESVADSIFAIAAEELGFVGALAIISLFILFALRAFHIARRIPDLFGKFLAIGIASWIVIQAFVNISAIAGLIPLTGVTLPFISHGGSSLALVLTSCGILVNISKHTKT